MDSPAGLTTAEVSEPIVNDAVKESRYTAAGLPAEKIRAAMRPVPLVGKGLTQRNKETGQIYEAQKDFGGKVRT